MEENKDKKNNGDGVNNTPKEPNKEVKPNNQQPNKPVNNQGQQPTNTNRGAQQPMPPKKKMSF